MVCIKAFIFHMLLFGVKVIWQGKGHISIPHLKKNKMAVKGALVFHKHSLLGEKKSQDLDLHCQHLKISVSCKRSVHYAKGQHIMQKVSALCKRSVHCATGQCIMKKVRALGLKATELTLS